MSRDDDAKKVVKAALEARKASGGLLGVYVALSQDQSLDPTERMFFARGALWKIVNKVDITWKLALVASLLSNLILYTVVILFASGVL
jgi:hypothetical protein